MIVDLLVDERTLNYCGMDRRARETHKQRRVMDNNGIKEIGVVQPLMENWEKRGSL
ncbi:hypothetical protein JOB18_008221 [Solea senegalensis]|uniref:Uncharacterized protein n=1 Tax=Solea senegalensis TaxID=28829 RepID=A0AAV6R3X3_SOLSE|nr:hypothetical protein JOB18_008221 [Solea senegalensis]